MKLNIYTSSLLAIIFTSITSVAQDSRIWGTYYGDSGNEGAFSVATDHAGNVYMAGITQSAAGIASGGFQNTFGGGVVDAFLVKFDSTGSRQWATYYGGTGDEMAFFGGKMGIAIDPNGDVYMAGFTSSTTGIASGGFQNAPGGTAVNAYLVKFNAAGNRLWGTYYGGISADKAYSVATDDEGNVYIAGIGGSAGLASGGFQNTNGGSSDAILVKFDSNGNRLWATYYGGANTEEGYCVITDNHSNVYLAGTTSSPTGIASGGYQNSYGGGASDLFLVKFNSAGSRLWATYYGGSGDEMILFAGDLDLATDYAGNIYLAGLTTSTSGIASGVYQNIYGGGSSDGFLVKVDSTGSRVWSTFYGGTGADNIYNVATDANGNIFFAGRTDSQTSMSYNGFQNSIGGSQDDFIAKFEPNGSLLCATYFGGTDVDECNGLAVDDKGNLYLGGATTNTTGIAYNGFQNFHGGGTSDAMLIKFTSCFNTVGANEILHSEQIIVYPNPTNGTLTIHTDLDGIQKLNFYNLLGEIVYHSEFLPKQIDDKLELDVAHLPPGIYQVEIISGDKTLHTEFVKQ